MPASSNAPGASESAPNPSLAPPTPTPLPPPAPPARRSRAPILIAVAVVVVVVVLIVALALAGILPFFKNGGGGPSTFASDRAAAQSAANGYPGGGWDLIGADGVASTVSISSSTSNLTNGLIGTGCTFSPAVGSPTNLTLGTVTDVSQGVSGSWLFLFKNSAGSSILLVANLDGATTVLGTMSGSTCFGGFLNVLGTLGTNIVDSTQAASTANTAGGSSFLTAHPGAWGSFLIVAGYSYLGFGSGPQWTVTYSACPLSPTASGTSAEFTATVNATSGGLLHAATTTVTCTGLGGGGTSGPGNTPIGTALALGTPTVQNLSGYAWNYSVGVTSAASGMTLSNVSLSVTTAGGTPVSLPTATLVAYSSGAIVGDFSLSSGAWTYGGSATLSSATSFSLYSYQYLGGDKLVVSGAGAYSGTVSVSLPAG